VTDGGAIRRGYVDVPWGQIHYATCGTGPPVVLVHQSPRSWDEFRAVMPLLAPRYRVVAADTAGFGASDIAPDGEETIERYADGLLAVVDALGIGPMSVVGHHTGALVALEVAARVPERVRALVLSSAPFKTPAERAAALGGRGVDAVEERADGGHLLELWRGRQAFYPAGRTDLLRRFLVDALRVGDRVEEGHRAVNRYAVEDRISLVTAPVYLVAATEDPYAYPMLERWEQAFPLAAVAEIPGGMVPLPDQMPAEFARAVVGFLGDGGGQPGR